MMKLETKRTRAGYLHPSWQTLGRIHQFFETDKSQSYFEVIKRLQVPGGWLVARTIESKQGELSQSMVFIPDETHEWAIEEIAPSDKQYPRGGRCLRVSMTFAVINTNT